MTGPHAKLPQGASIATNVGTKRRAAHCKNSTKIRTRVRIVGYAVSMLIKNVCSRRIRRVLRLECEELVAPSAVPPIVWEELKILDVRELLESWDIGRSHLKVLLKLPLLYRK